MKGKSWEMPPGMFFGKYYCAKCGEKLKREKTHRVVTPEDKDYYAYHNRGRFPKPDYDVYGYRFACPNCGNRVAYREQRILSRIQKKQETRVLAASEIKANYPQCKAAEKKQAFLTSLLLPAFMVLMVLITLYAAYVGGTLKESFRATGMILLVAGLFTVSSVVKHKRGSKMLGYDYSYEEKTQMERLHAYCTGNRDLVARANRCYCVYCKADMDRREIVDFLELENTAVCPKCGVDAVLPDSIDETISRSLLQELHEYWF